MSEKEPATQWHILDRRPLYMLTREYDAKGFDEMKDKVAVVCAGDSLTGWNFRQYSHPSIWPFPTYPDFLQEMLISKGPLLKVVNGGMPGTTSDIGFFSVMSYLDLFKNAKYFIIEYGANDLAGEGNIPEKSEHIIANLKEMIDAVLAEQKQPILVNVPNVNEAICPTELLGEVRAKRDYHNQNLIEHFGKKIPIVDIRTKLKNEHFGDSLHTNETGARIIAEEIYEVLRKIHSECSA